VLAVITLVVAVVVSEMNTQFHKVLVVLVVAVMAEQTLVLDLRQQQILAVAVEVRVEAHQPHALAAMAVRAS
jgi:hypothetical protein